MTHPSLKVLTTEGHGASKRGSHQIATVFQCPRKWYLRYRKGIREREDKEYRMAGTLGHLAIAHRYAERIIEQGIWPAPTWWDGRSIDDALETVGEGWPQLVPVARELYDAYPNYWWHGTLAEPWEPVAVEEQFFARLGDLDPLPDGVEDLWADEVITCGTDLVVRNTVTDMLWIPDHKSKGFDPFGRSSSPRMEPWRRDSEQYTVHWQALVNLLIVRQAFPDKVVGGFIINRFTRKQPFLFDRHTLHVSPRVYAEAPAQIRRAVMEEARIDNLVNAGGRPAPNYWACHGKYGCCDYVELCNADDDAQMNRVLSSKFVAA